MAELIIFKPKLCIMRLAALIKVRWGRPRGRRDIAVTYPELEKETPGHQDRVKQMSALDKQKFSTRILKLALPGGRLRNKHGQKVETWTFFPLSIVEIRPTDFANKSQSSRVTQSVFSAQFVVAESTFSQISKYCLLKIDST